MLTFSSSLFFFEIVDNIRVFIDDLRQHNRLNLLTVRHCTISESCVEYDDLKQKYLDKFSAPTSHHRKNRLCAKAAISFQCLTSTLYSRYGHSNTTSFVCAKWLIEKFPLLAPFRLRNSFGTLAVRVHRLWPKQTIRKCCITGAIWLGPVLRTNSGKSTASQPA